MPVSKSVAKNVPSNPSDFIISIIFEETNIIGAETNVPSTILVPIYRIKKKKVSKY